MHLQPLSFVVSLAVFLVFTSSVAAHRSNCSVPHYRVQRNFEPHKFSGRWFGVKYMNTSLFPIDLGYGNVVYTFQERDDGNYTMITEYRNHSIANNTMPCARDDRAVVRMPNVGTAISARMTLQMSPDEPELPFWVMDTDYTSYAVIYQCLNWTHVELTTFCPLDMVKSWVLARNLVPLTDKQWKGINHTLRYYCTEDYHYYWVDHDEPGCSSCDPNLWTIQPGFNLSRFAGRWHEALLVSPDFDNADEIMTDYVHEYSVDNGEISVTITGRTRGNPPICLNNKTAIINTTAVTGKLTIQWSPTDIVWDYMVVCTDYDGYAVVLGCGQVTDGRCQSVQMFVLSREPYLTGPQAAVVQQLMSMYCIPVNRLLGIQQDNTCFPPPSTPPTSPPPTVPPKECKGNSATKSDLHVVAALLMAIVAFPGTL